MAATSLGEFSLENMVTGASAWSTTPFEVSYNSTSAPNTTGQQEIKLSPEDERFYIVLWTYVTPTVLAFITIIGTTGNALVVHAILNNKQLKTSTNLLLLNLAIADITFLLLCVPCTAYKYAASNWVFGDIGCKIVSYYQYVTSYVTVWTLVAISALRYMTIIMSIQTAKYRTKANIIRLSVVIWVTMTAVNVPILVVSKVKVLISYTYCGMELWSVGPIFVTFCVFGYLLPLTIIVLLYLQILMHLRNSKDSSISHTHVRERNIRVCKLIVLVVVVFMLSWLPKHINNLTALDKTLPPGKLYEVLRVLWEVLSYGNSCANPFIYTYACRDFRKCFKEAFICKKKEETSKRLRSNGTIQVDTNDIKDEAEAENLV